MNLGWHYNPEGGWQRGSWDDPAIEPPADANRSVDWFAPGTTRNGPAAATTPAPADLQIPENSPSFQDSLKPPAAAAPADQLVKGVPNSVLFVGGLAAAFGVLYFVLRK